MQVNMLEAKNQLSRLVKAALAGEEVIIANNGVPAVRLVTVASAKPQRQPGAWANLPMPDEDWDSEVVNREIAESFHASVLFPDETP
jgi:prevent-host-death family protein